MIKLSLIVRLYSVVPDALLPQMAESLTDKTKFAVLEWLPGTIFSKLNTIIEPVQSRVMEEEQGDYDLHVSFPSSLTYFTTPALT